MKQKTPLHGTYRARFILSDRIIQTTTWQIDKISGKLVAWNDEVISIQKRHQRHLIYKVPIEDIEKIEIKGFNYGCLGAYQGAIFGFITVAWVTEKRGIEEGDILLPAIGVSVLGTALGSYIGLKADTPEEKGILIFGAVIATGIVVVSIVALYSALVVSGIH